MSLYVWLITWLDKYEKNTIKRTTYVNYEGHIHNHFNVFDKVEISDVTTPILQDFFNNKFDSGLSSKTIRNMAIILKRAMKQAVADGLIQQNCALYVNLPKIVRKEIQVLTHSQKRDLIKVSYFYRYGVFVRLTLCTGLRLGELLGLKWIDIDFQKNELKIRRILHRCKNYDPNAKTSTSIYFDEPKTEKSKRTIPLPPNAIEDLKKWKDRQQKEIGQVEFVVTDQQGKYIEHTTFKKYYNRMLDKCGIKDITFHTLRHTFATHALEKGMDKKVLSEILGHSSVSFTLDTYAHVLNTFKRENMELMNDIYESDSQPQKLILSFKPFKDQYIVSIPDHSIYTFIASSIQEGIDYIEEKRDEIRIIKPLNLPKILEDKSASDILVFLK